MRPLLARLLPFAVGAALLAVPAQASALTETFGFTGDEQTFIVPPGVTAVGVEATGAAGEASAAPGGRGAVVTGSIPVTPGQTLFVEVGAAGNYCNGAGAYGMGAAGDAADGGGAADVRTISVADGGGTLCGYSFSQSTPSLNSRLVVAGGGGGGSLGESAGAGGDAGQPGHNGVDSTAGGAGSMTGAGGAGEPYGEPGALGTGGRGNSCCPWYSGGGGGGGLYGGGGGGAGFTSGSGGGGGSSLVPDGGTFALASGPAQVVISTDFELGVAIEGSGSVTSRTGGIDCGSACAARYDGGSAVTLDAAPAAGQAFVSWGGACSGTSTTCEVTMDRARSVTATFGNAAPRITDLEVTPDPFVADPDTTPLGRPSGAKIKLKLSEDARVDFRVRRNPPRRDAGPPPRSPRKFSRELELGGNSVDFTGTLGDRTFPPGRYQLIARARDGGGLRSKRIRTQFRIKG